MFFFVVFFPVFVQRLIYNFHLLPTASFICLIIGIVLRDVWVKGSVGRGVVAVYLLSVFMFYLYNLVTRFTV